MVAVSPGWIPYMCMATHVTKVRVLCPLHPLSPVPSALTNSLYPSLQRAQVLMVQGSNDVFMPECLVSNNMVRWGAILGCPANATQEGGSR